MKPKSVFLCFLFLMIYYAVNAQNSTSVSEVVSRLKAYKDLRPDEKVYLHFDKPYYAAGDTIYFKAYVTIGDRHQLSPLSGVLHVDLININGTIDQFIQVQLNKGIGWGDFGLPVSLPKSNYRIRAYTQWMRNNGPDNYFEQTFSVSSMLNNKTPEKVAVSIQKNKPDIQFMPEGGTLVAGIRSKVAFKAIGSDGKGIDVKGIISDNENNKVSAFSSIRLGMGYFFLKPVFGETYSATVAYPDGTQATIDLPKSEEEGVILSVNNDSIPKASIKIEANETYYKEHKGKTYTLLVYAGGLLTTIPTRLDSTVVDLDILKRRLHTGIATITLFSPEGKPLSERLLFIQNFNSLDLKVAAGKPAYPPKEKVIVKVNVKNRADSAAKGCFSVSVTDAGIVPFNENSERTILTELLLTSDLKGTVEQPNYYFTNITDTKLKELDLVMLTHGYRSFEWKQVLGNGNQSPIYQAEKGIEINGTLKNLLNNPVANSNITLLPVKNGTVLTALTDNKGAFHFSDLIFFDTCHFALSAVNVKGKNITDITCSLENSEVNFPDQLTSFQMASDTAAAIYTENARKRRNEFINSNQGEVTKLKEVEIRGKYETQNFAGAGNADQILHADEIGQIQGPLSTSLDGRLRGVIFVGQGGIKFLCLHQV